MMKKLFLISVLFSLAACHQEKPQPITQQVYCLTTDQYKQLVDAQPPSIRENLTGNAQQDFKVMTGQNVLLRIYANGLLKILGGCIGPSPSDA